MSKDKTPPSAKVSVEQETVEEGAEKYYKQVRADEHVTVQDVFLAGAEWALKHGQRLEPAIGHGEWQLCPKCNGRGEMYVNDSYKVPSTTAITMGWFTCDVCNGAKILAKPIIPATK